MPGCLAGHKSDQQGDYKDIRHGPLGERGVRLQQGLRDNCRRGHRPCLHQQLADWHDQAEGDDKHRHQVVALSRELTRKAGDGLRLAVDLDTALHPVQPENLAEHGKHLSRLAVCLTTGQSVNAEFSKIVPLYIAAQRQHRLRDARVQQCAGSDDAQQAGELVRVGHGIFHLCAPVIPNLIP